MGGSSRAIGTLVALLLIVSARPTAQPARSADEILRLPLSPGSVALLVEHVAQPPALARLGSALRDSNPEVRAAAARVLFVTGLKEFAAPVALALARETAETAAIEQAVFLASFGTPDHYSIVQAHWPRLGPVVALRSAEVVAMR